MARDVIVSLEHRRSAPSARPPPRALRWQQAANAASPAGMEEHVPVYSKRTSHLRANDNYRTSSLVIFSFLIATFFVFFLSVAADFVRFLALLACCTYCVGGSTFRAMKRLTRSVHRAMNWPLVSAATPPLILFLRSHGTLPQMALRAHLSPFS